VASWKGLNGVDPALKAGLDHGRRLHLNKGDVLFRHGDLCPGFIIVLSGSVRVSRVDAEGKEIVLYRVGAGQSCMLTTMCLMGHQPYPAGGVAESDVELVLLSAMAFERLLATSAALRNIALQHMAQRMADLMLLIEDLAFGRMDQRLAQLLMQCQLHGSVLMTHQELARELGTAREVVSRLLKSFEAKGWLRLQRGKIDILDDKALHALANQVVHTT